MNILEHITQKIITVAQWHEIQRSNIYQQVVFTNGCFDLLHRGHITYLAQARALGDCLVVGLNSDTSVRRLKGSSRPINSQDDRALLLAACSFIDYVILFEEDTPYTLIQQVMPNILVKGNDYALDQIVGADLVIQNGGSVQTIPFVEGYSSTRIIQKMK